MGNRNGLEVETQQTQRVQALGVAAREEAVPEMIREQAMGQRINVTGDEACHIREFIAADGPWKGMVVRARASLTSERHDKMREGASPPSLRD